jgi:hypothetical protein
MFGDQNERGGRAFCRVEEFIYQLPAVIGRSLDVVRDWDSRAEFGILIFGIGKWTREGNYSGPKIFVNENDV